MIEFNNQGYITPADSVETDFENFEKTFVFNEQRQIIFQEYLVFLGELKTLNIGSFYQWINGSFTTLKTNPNDIDVVTFIPYKEYQEIETELWNLKQTFRNRAVDAYFIAIYPEEHDSYSLFLNYD